MKLYRLYKRQELNIEIDYAWDLFSSPENLKKITPPYMGFEIISNLGQNKMHSGMIIEYIVHPFLNIPFYWVTEITHVEEKHFFVDEQRFGPYKFWHHLHRFTIENGKVVMEDIVNYALPFGVFGRIAHFLFIRKRIEEIFNYRERILSSYFP